MNYDGFYELEIGMRRTLNYPPFADMVIVTFTGQDEARVLRGGAKFRDSLTTLLKDPQYGAQNSTVLGPAPCPVPKINYNFHRRQPGSCGASITGDVSVRVSYSSLL